MKKISISLSVMLYCMIIWACAADYTGTPTNPNNPGKPHALPGVIEAEWYDKGGEGISYHSQAGGFGSDGCKGATGDKSLNKIASAGDWIKYTISSAKDKTYNIIVRLRYGGVGGNCKLYLDDVDISGRVDIVNTGWGCTVADWADHFIPNVQVPAGTHVLKIEFTKGNPNFDYIMFENLPAANAPVFSYFEYTGDDAVYKQQPLAADEFYIPILQGPYPDPCITRKGNDYYMTNSSFTILPGIPVFHSTDLVNWKQISHVLVRPSQFNPARMPLKEGIMASDIKYNPYNDTFYMLSTAKLGLSNFVMKTKDPAGDWGEPIQLPYGGIDPSFFFDDDGKAYIVHNQPPASGNQLYSGHQIINIVEYDLEKDCLKGGETMLVNGGVDISTKPDMLEGPHLYKKNGYYYLLCAEGGTLENHRAVIFRSTSVKGEYTPGPVNPILTQKGLPSSRKDKVTCTGHADIISTPDGNYYGVFLGVRPTDSNGYEFMGRETFILPVDWSGEFPVFVGGLEAIPAKLKLPAGAENKTGKDGYLPNGNFTYRDTFQGDRLDFRWFGVRGAYDNFVSLTPEGLSITPYRTSIRSKDVPSAVFCRQQHKAFTAETSMKYTPVNDGDFAGIVCYLTEDRHCLLGVTRKNGLTYVTLEKTESGVTTQMATASASERVRLQVQSDGAQFIFRYAVGDGAFIQVGSAISANVMAMKGITHTYLGCMIGLYTTKADVKPEPEVSAIPDVKSDSNALSGVFDSQTNTVYFTAGNGEIIIYDSAGKKIESRLFRSGQSDLSFLQAGVYNVLIQAAGATATMKLIKQ